MSKEVIENSRFSPRVCAFNPERDLQEVDQFGFVNLNETFEKGIVPSFIEGSDESFNGVSVPGTLISRASDVFDGLRKADYVRGQLNRLNSADRDKVENAVERVVDASGDVTS